VEAFARMRRESRMPVPRRVENAKLKQIACGMAENGKLSAKPALALPDVQAAVAYTANSPDDLPDSMEKLRDNRFKRYSLGTCFARNDSYPSGVYWVVFVTYFN
jgi:hypothetical protein